MTTEVIVYNNPVQQYVWHAIMENPIAFLAPFAMLIVFLIGHSIFTNVQNYFRAKRKVNRHRR